MDKIGLYIGTQNTIFWFNGAFINNIIVALTLGTSYRM